jgi:multiple sugar transport system permease protein
VKNTRPALNAAIAVCAFLVLAVELFPILITIASGFRRDIEILSAGPFSLKFTTRSWYLVLFKSTEFLGYVGNSVLVAALSTTLSLGAGSLAAYGISRFRFHGRDALAYSFLVFRMLPQISLVVAMYMMFQAIGARDTIWGLTLAHSSFYEEAALVDGCSRFQTFRRVFLPLAASGLVVAAVFAFIMSWNEFLYALILTSTRAKTAPLHVAGFIAADGLKWGQLYAAGTVLLVPVFVFTVTMQKFLVHGITAGGVKG